MELAWAEGNKTEHREALKRFTCAQARRRASFRLPDPHPWATEVQTWVRQKSLTETNEFRSITDQRLRLGHENGRVVAVGAHSRYPELTTNEVTTRILIGFAVSLDLQNLRSKGGKSYADAAIEEIFDDCIEREPVGRLALAALVHVRNIPSEKVLQRWKLEPNGDAATGSQYRLWTGIIRDR